MVSRLLIIYPLKSKKGQWRFIESLSTYASLFLEKLDRPHVDEIHNIRPAIALEQKNPVRGSRCTVGTLTELYELFRLLYAKIATPCCPVCSREIRMWDPSLVIAELLEHYPGEKALVIFRTEEETEALKKRGFYRIWRDGEVKDLDAFLRESPHRLPEASFDIVLDRMIIKEGPRLADSIEMAWREGQGKIQVIIVGGRRSLSVSYRLLLPQRRRLGESENRAKVWRVVQAQRHPSPLESTG